MSDLATLSGGKVAVTGSVRVGVLGAEAGAPTTLNVGVVPVVSLRAVRLEHQAEELNTTLLDRRDQYAQMNDAGKALTHREREQVTEPGARICEIEEDIGALEIKRAKVDKKVDRLRTVDAIIHQTIHAGVSIGTNDRQATFRARVEGPVVIGWDDQRQLLFRQEGESMQPLSELARVFDRAPQE